MTTRGESGGHVLHGTLGAEDVRALFERCASLGFTGLLELSEGPRRTQVPFVEGEPLDGPDLFKLGAVWRRGSYRLVQRAVDFQGNLTDGVVLQGTLRETAPMQLFRHCEDGRLSAEIAFDSGDGQRAHVRFARGRLEGAEINGQPNMGALATLGGWSAGSFRLVLAPLFAAEAGSAPAVAASSPPRAGAPAAAKPGGLTGVRSVPSDVFDITAKVPLWQVDGDEPPPSSKADSLDPLAEPPGAPAAAAPPAATPAAGPRPSLFASSSKAPAAGSGPARPSPFASTAGRAAAPTGASRAPTPALGAASRPSPSFARPASGAPAATPPAATTPPAAVGAPARPAGTPLFASSRPATAAPSSATPVAGRPIGAPVLPSFSAQPRPGAARSTLLNPPVAPVAAPVSAPSASGWDLPDDETPPPDSEWGSTVESATVSPPSVRPAPPPSYGAGAATVPDLSATIQTLLPEAANRSFTPSHVKATLPGWDSEETPPPEPISSAADLLAGPVVSISGPLEPISGPLEPISGPLEPITGPLDPISTPIELTRRAPPRPLPSIIVEDVTPLPVPPSPARRSGPVSSPSLAGPPSPASSPTSSPSLPTLEELDEVDVEPLDSPFMAPPPVELAPPLPAAPSPPRARPESDDVPFRPREIRLTPAPSAVVAPPAPSMVAEAAPVQDAGAIFPPPLMSGESAALGEFSPVAERQPVSRTGWIWVGAMLVLGAAAAFALWPRAPGGLATVDPVVGRPPPANAPPTATSRPPAIAAAPTAPAPVAPAAVPPPSSPTADAVARLVAGARKATIEGNKKQALKLFKSAWKLNPKDPSFAIYVPMTLGKKGKGKIVLEGKGAIVVDGHSFTAPRKLSVAAGPHTVEIGGRAQEVTVAKGATQRISATAGVIPPGGAPRR